MKFYGICVLMFIIISSSSFSSPTYILDEFERIVVEDHSSNDSAEIDEEILYLRPNTTQLFSELYRRYGLLHNPELTVIEQAPYLDQVGAPAPFPMQPANRAIFNHAESILKEFHFRSGNLDLFLEPGDDDTFFYTANGSIQIIYALVYAIATTYPDQKFVFAEKIPYYSGHQAAVELLFDYPNVRWLGFTKASDIKVSPEETLIEFVTSPNNPDGVPRVPETDAETIIADFVFASSAYGDGTGYLENNLAWVSQARARGKNIFSFNSSSKQFGKTGCRTGYIWFPLKQPFGAAIFPQFFNYISLSTVGSGTSGLSIFLDLISAFLSRTDTGQNVRQNAYASLVKRFDILSQEVVLRYPGSTVVSVAGSPALFVHLSDSRLPAKSAREIIFDDLRTSVSGGVPFGATDAFFRVSLTGYSAELAQFANRLVGCEKYTPEDFLISSEHVCNRVKICGRRKQNTQYVVNPNNCVIEADAKEGPIVIMLPELIDYDASNVIAIKKTDRSRHQVIVQSRTFTRILSKRGDQILVQWRQPNFLDGEWAIKGHKRRCADRKS